MLDLFSTQQDLSLKEQNGCETLVTHRVQGCDLGGYDVFWCPVVRYNLFWANKGQRERDIRKDPQDLDLAA